MVDKRILADTLLGCTRECPLFMCALGESREAGLLTHSQPPDYMDSLLPADSIQAKHSFLASVRAQDLGLEDCALCLATAQPSVSRLSALSPLVVAFILQIFTTGLLYIKHGSVK